MSVRRGVSRGPSDRRQQSSARRLDPRALLANRKGAADAPLYLICKGGTRGKQACEKFVAAGITNVVNVEGGTQACVEAGLPVVRGKKGMSLERQVRIVAGALVVTGAALGYFVDPRWIGLSAFVGGAGVRRGHRHLRHGDLAGTHALEPGRRLRVDLRHEVSNSPKMLVGTPGVALLAHSRHQTLGGIQLC